jgi:hypothetical protein
VTEYNSSDNHKGTKRVIEVINDRALLQLGTSMFFKGIKVSSITISRRHVARAYITRHEHIEHALNVVVYTLKWIEPVISDDSVTCMLPPGHIDEIVNINYHPKWGVELMRVTPPVTTRKPSPRALRVGKAISNIIVNSVTGREGNVFIVAGPTGVGKSFAGRLAVHLMSACLYDEFDPRRQQTPFSIAYHTRNEEQRLVLMLNECDVVFRTVDKAVRNNMMDKVNNNPQKLVLILTTNMRLEDMHKTDPSLIREGRMTKIEVTDDGYVHIVTDEMLEERMSGRGNGGGNGSDSDSGSDSGSGSDSVQSLLPGHAFKAVDVHTFWLNHARISDAVIRRGVTDTSCRTRTIQV